MLMLSHNINSMLCRSFPSVWQVRPIRVKLPCVCVCVCLVFFCCCSCILPTSGLTRIINSVNSLKRIIPFFRKQHAKKITSWQNTINASLKSFLYFLISFGCSSLVPSSALLHCSCCCFFSKNASFGIVVVLLDTLGSFLSFDKRVVDTETFVPSFLPVEVQVFFVVMLVVKLKYHYFFECNYEIID